MTIQTDTSLESTDLDRLDSIPVEHLADDELVGEVRRLARLRAQVEARSAEVVAAAHRRGVPQAQGFASPTAWLIAATGDPPPVCRSRVRVALSLQHMDHTRQAFAAGELSECRVRLLVGAWDDNADVFCHDEALLVAQARTLPARLFPLALTHWRRLADADGAVADAARAFLARRLHISATWAGTVRLDGDLDPESGQTVLTAIRSLAEPAALNPGDRRSPKQRRADALVEICRRHLDSRDRPRQGGERPHLIITLTPADLAGDGLIDLETGPITAEAVRRIACDAIISRVVLDADSKPIDSGRKHRVVSPALRRALHQRDRHCTYPGCDIPARWCNAHHILHWAHGGKTEMSNLRLLCRTHHHGEHEEQQYPRRQ